MALSSTGSSLSGFRSGFVGRMASCASCVFFALLLRTGHGIKGGEGGAGISSACYHLDCVST